NDPRQAAVHALRNIGPGAQAAVPALLDVLEVEPDGLGMLAALALEAIGPEARSALPRLEPLVHGSVEEAAMAIQALGGIGPEAVPLLTVALRREGAAERVRAARALAKLVPECGAATAALIDAVGDPYYDLRSTAISALGPAVPTEPRVMPILLAALE